MKLLAPTPTTEKGERKDRNETKPAVFIAIFLTFIMVGAVIAGMIYLKKKRPRW
jgi:hypothetical protein